VFSLMDGAVRHFTVEVEATDAAVLKEDVGVRIAATNSRERMAWAPKVLESTRRMVKSRGLARFSAPRSCVAQPMSGPTRSTSPEQGPQRLILPHALTPKHDSAIDLKGGHGGSNIDRDAGG
jgi:hypothetical protein